MDSARSAQRRRARRRAAVRRRRAVALLVLAGVAALALMASSGGGAPPRRPPARATAATHSTSSTSTTSTSRTTSTAAAHTVSPGSLPQTDARPGDVTRAVADALWAGVVHDSTRLALPAFFPEGAYAQLKAIGDARGDWADRLVADFGLDIGAAHALLGRDAAQ